MGALDFILIILACQYFVVIGLIIMDILGGDEILAFKTKKAIALSLIPFYYLIAMVKGFKKNSRKYYNSLK